MNTDNLEQYEVPLMDIVNSGISLISDIKPSAWTEQNMVMPKPFPGPFRYNRTPYTREIIDCLSPDHPARTVAVMKGAQIGFSSGVIYPGCGWIIKNHPGNTLLMVGAPDLIEKSMEKLDLMIDNCEIRNLIRPQAQRRKSQKTGDTNLKKEFPGGYISVGSANNHKAIRQIEVQYGFIDDFESIKAESKESGSTRKLLEQRFAAFADTHKIFYISTPERKENSNIEEAFMLGDQRKYLIPCPVCGAHIELKWTAQVDEKESGGIFYQVDNTGRLIASSVGYVCQVCSGFFNDKKKHEWLLERGHGGDAYWQPQAETSKVGYYSYHINSLYAPLGMFDWEHYANDYIEANPQDQPRKEKLMRTFVNVCLGEPYEEAGESIKATQLMKYNIQQYDINTIPEKLSLAHGNGQIVLLTCACDMNGTAEDDVKGTIDDARLDYEIVAHSASGSTYSICHGSIGTFVPNETNKENKAKREKWSYYTNKENSVWRVLDQILGTVYTTDTGRQMRITTTGLDTGYLEHLAFSYIDSCNFAVFGLKGDGKEQKYEQGGKEPIRFRKGLSRSNLYMLRVNHIKDDLAELIRLKWTAKNNPQQPPGFMNYPTPSAGKYLYENFFAHYEAEQRLPGKDGDWIWQKKTAVSQNHLWDCRVYNMAIRDIFLFEIQRAAKLKTFTWGDYCEKVLGE